MKKTPQPNFPPPHGVAINESVLWRVECCTCSAVLSVKRFFLEIKLPSICKLRCWRDFFKKKNKLKKVVEITRFLHVKSKSWSMIMFQIQLNKYETDPYILQIFQSNTWVCLIISVFYNSVFYKSCEPMLCEPEIVQKICSP